MTDDWWTKTSDALLRRLLGYGAGEGPPQDQTARLAKGLQISFRAPESDDLGERTVRAFLQADKESSDQLYISLCDTLVARAGPIVMRELAVTQSAEDERPTVPSAAIRTGGGGGGGQAEERPHRPTGTSVVRPKPRKPKEEDGDPGEYGWWQKVIWDSAKRAFTREWHARERVYEEYVAALDPPEQAKFVADASVRPNQMLWETRFDFALKLSMNAKGLKPPELQLDDAYHAIPKDVPAGLRSTSLLGELVHAAWQFEYLDAEPLSSVLGEYMFFAGALPGSRIRRMDDYREIMVNEEEPTWLGAAAWAFGKQKPDIIDFDKRRIIEIKPIRSAPAGVLQLWRYTHNFNCARYFDELRKPGATGDHRYAIEPQHPSANTFKVLDLNEFLESYFRARDDEKDEAGRPRRGIPKKRRRVGRSQVERVVRAGRKLTVWPHMWPECPGLVIYTVHETKKGEEPDDPWAPPPIDTAKVAVVVTALVLVTVVFVVFALPAIFGALAAGGSTAALAETTTLGVGVAVGAGLAASQVAAADPRAAQIETFGVGVPVDKFNAAVSEVGTQVDRLTEARVLN